MIVYRHGYYIFNPYNTHVVLNGLKQNTSYGWRACDVWDGRVIMFKPISCAYDITFKIT
jgi:hypothetical protein